MLNNPVNRRWFLLGGLCLLAAAPLARDLWPLVNELVPRCPFHVLTGLHCPGCGTWRALSAFVQGDWRLAAACNPILCLAVPLLAWEWCRPPASPVQSTAQPERRRFPATSRLVLLVVCTYWILRNVPLFPFTLLAPVSG